MKKSFSNYSEKGGRHWTGAAVRVQKQKSAGPRNNLFFLVRPKLVRVAVVNFPKFFLRHLNHMAAFRASFLDFPASIVQNVNLKSYGLSGLLCELHYLGNDQIVECAFTLQKDSGDEAEDCSNYLDESNYTPKKNKLICKSERTHVFVIRNIRIGTWAKSSRKEGAYFVLCCRFFTAEGRVADAVSSPFKLLSHQSQLYQNVKECRRTIFSASLIKFVDVEEDAVGLESLADAALKVESSEESAGGVIVMLGEEGLLKKARLLERADGLALRIRKLQEEESLVHNQISFLADETNKK
jgi:hypothetical protein